MRTARLLHQVSALRKRNQYLLRRRLRHRALEVSGDVHRPERAVHLAAGAYMRSMSSYRKRTMSAMTHPLHIVEHLVFR